MDPKKQAELFYKSLAASDAASCKLLARGARMQRGRVAALERRIAELEAKNAEKSEINKLKLESSTREKLANTYDALDEVIGTAIDDRAQLDKNKFEQP